MFAQAYGNGTKNPRLQDGSFQNNIQDSETLTIQFSWTRDSETRVKKSRDFETWPKIAETQANFGDHSVALW